MSSDSENTRAQNVKGINKRSIQIDILRIVAVLLVLGRHADPFPHKDLPVIGYAFDLWEHCGWIGVDLFFVLSGYLVSGLLFREYARYRSINFKNFFLRRGLKIYPAFYLLILFTVVVRVLTGNGFDLTGLAAELLFVQNYVGGLWEHTWSLAVEEHFYILLPLTLILLYRKNGRSENPFTALPAIFVVVALTSIVLRLLTFETLDYSYHTHLFPTHLRLGSLFFGVLLSYYSHFEPVRLRAFQNKPLLASAGGFACVAPVFLLPVYDNFFVNTFGLTFLYLGFGVLLLIALRWQRLARLAQTKPGIFLAYLGAHSYSIYLWHLAVKQYGAELTELALGFQPSYMIRWTTYIAGSIVGGVLMAKLVEFPVLKLRDRFFPSRQEAPLAPGT